MAIQSAREKDLTTLGSAEANDRPGHASRRRKHDRECRDVGIELGVKPDVSRDIAPAEVGDHASPDDKVGFGAAMAFTTGTDRLIASYASRPFCRSRAPYESFSRGSLRDLRGTGYASRDGI